MQCLMIYNRAARAARRARARARVLGGGDSSARSALISVLLERSSIVVIIIIVIIVIIIISSEITKDLKLGSSVPHSYPPEFKASFYTLLARLRHFHLNHEKTLRSSPLFKIPVFFHNLRVSF